MFLGSFKKLFSYVKFPKASQLATLSEVTTRWKLSTKVKLLSLKTIND